MKFSVNIEPKQKLSEGNWTENYFIVEISEFQVHCSHKNLAMMWHLYWFMFKLNQKQKQAYFNRTFFFSLHCFFF